MASNMGPQLPPHLQRVLESNSSDEDDSASESNDSIGPQLPTDNETRKKDVCGPQLPPHLMNSKDKIKKSCSSATNYGPSLPPGYSLEGDNDKGGVGPELPSHMKSSLVKKEEDNDDNDDDDDDEIVGPMLPSDTAQSRIDVAADFEARAMAMKNKLTGNAEGETTLKRETWMTELPPEFSKNFGMGPRTFRTKAQDLGDRSVWTDTPADRKRREEAKESVKPDEPPAKKKPSAPTSEEIQLHASVKEYNEKNRPQSLLEMHRAKNEGKTSELRKPFDRSRDLSLHKKDPKEVDQLIKGAKNMNDKFSSGSYSNKFL